MELYFTLSICRKKWKVIQENRDLAELQQHKIHKKVSEQMIFIPVSFFLT